MLCFAQYDHKKECFITLEVSLRHALPEASLSGRIPILLQQGSGILTNVRSFARLRMTSGMIDKSPIEIIIGENIPLLEKHYGN